MSSTEKTLLWVGVAIIVIGGVWWLVAGQDASPSAAGDNAGGVMVTSTTTTTNMAPGDTSDASINSDLSTMGTQMNGLSSDSASINSGINDQPVSQ